MDNWEAVYFGQREEHIKAERRETAQGRRDHGAGGGAGGGGLECGYENKGSRRRAWRGDSVQNTNGPRSRAEESEGTGSR